MIFARQRKDFNNADSYFVQARIQAYDTAYADNRVESDLVISVQRNANGPIFSEVRYEYSIAETFPVGDLIGTPVATDADGVS